MTTKNAARTSVMAISPMMLSMALAARKEEHGHQDHDADTQDFKESHAGTSVADTSVRYARGTTGHCRVTSRTMRGACG